MIPTPPDRFEEWFRLPVAGPEGDPRFEVRRARPEEFPRIYDCVDAAFGRKRPRALFDWLYLGNPFGRARCWIVLERASDTILKTGASFPWPIWRGRQPLLGALSGDACTVPAWQRKGLAAVRRAQTRAHPWYSEFCGIAGPNEGSRTVSQKAGEGDQLLGALRGASLPLRAAPLLERFGAPARVAGAFGRVADGVLSAWRQRARRGSARAGGRVEQITRFGAGFDEVTLRCMDWPLYWSPHNTDFLNWRYLAHPVESYVAVALIEDEVPKAYAVVCLERDKATLAELAVDSPDRAAKLLAAVIDVAHDAGCGSLNFFAPPGWRHWRALTRAGFLPYRTNNHLEVFGKQWEPEVLDIRNWQVVPGDRDFR